MATRSRSRCLLACIRKAFTDNPNSFAVLDGPLVLASQVDRNKPFPAVIADAPTLTASLAPVAGKPNTFLPSADAFRIPEEANSGVVLEPFYKIYGTRRYEVYWDRFTPEQWTEKQTEYRTKLAEQKAIEARTVDMVDTGEEQNERDHNLKGEKMDTREFNDTLCALPTRTAGFPTISRCTRMERNI